MINLSRRSFVRLAAAAVAATAVPLSIAPAAAAASGAPASAAVAADTFSTFAIEWWDTFTRLTDPDKLRYSQILRGLDPRFSELCDMIDRGYAPAKRNAMGVRGKQA